MVLKSTALVAHPFHVIFLNILFKGKPFLIEKDRTIVNLLPVYCRENNWEVMEAEKMVVYPRIDSPLIWLYGGEWRLSYYKFTVEEGRGAETSRIYKSTRKALQHSDPKTLL